MARSSIEWTESTWNPLTGCDKISPGCKNCYAERMALRLQAMGQPKYGRGFELTIHEKALFEPLAWKRPQRVFVNSMSDLFHEDVPLQFITRVFDVMRQAHWHQFQVLTKRAARLLELSPHLEWPQNVWMGVSIESQQYAFRIDHLRGTQAHIKFLSCEPLLGPLRNIDLGGVDWLIAGAESGPRARAMSDEWVRDLRDQCQAAGVAFFFKQRLVRGRKEALPLLDGRNWSDWPQGRSAARIETGGCELATQCS